MRNLHLDIMNMKLTPQAIGITPKIQKARERIQELRNRIADRDKQLKQVIEKATSLKAELEALESKKAEQPSTAFNGLMAFLKPKHTKGN